MKYDSCSNITEQQLLNARKNAKTSIGELDIQVVSAQKAFKMHFFQVSSHL